MTNNGILNNSMVDPNKILPMKYKWARRYYKAGVNNNWTPEEIPMMDDIELWKKNESQGGLTEEERRMVLYNLGFFSTAESLTANNIVLAVYKHVTNPECRQYLLRQAFEESIHTDMFIYSCDSLGLNPDEIYNMYNKIPSIQQKDEFVVAMTSSLLDDRFTTDSVEGMQKFVNDLVGFYVIMEGIFFYAGFAMMLQMLRQHKMIGIGEQFQYVLRDETLHLAFGSDLINTIVAENPNVWTQEFKQSIIDNVKKGVELEDAYSRDCLPRGILGINSGIIREYLEYIADRRLERIGLPTQFATQNPFPWMSEIMDVRKEKNFFETRVIEYQTSGSLQWE